MTSAANIPVVDPDLIARYDVAGPRYTSYPSATHFRDDFGESALAEAIQRSNTGAEPRPVSLYVHIPFCTSPCFYCGCNRVITRDIGKADLYLEFLVQEVDRMARLVDRRRPVRQLHFGGGTPNFLDLPRMTELMARLQESFGFDTHEGGEYGIEIDPRFADGDYIRRLGALGFNRISVGIQDFDPAVQQAVNRIQSVAMTRDVLEAARASGFSSANVDLIYGLPRQTVTGFERTLAEVVGLGPNRIAVYGYAHLPRLFKAQRQIVAGDLPDAPTRLALLGAALRHLTAAGYVYIGMDHFAREDDELVMAQRARTLQRNFQGYSTHGECDIVGLGMSAISRIDDTYSQNARDLPAYYAALEAGRLPVIRGTWLDRDDLIRRQLIGELMCHGSIDKEAFGQLYGLSFDDYFEEALQRLDGLASDGLVDLSTESIRVTGKGQLLLRNIAMCFDAYLMQESPITHYSRAI